MKKKKPKIYQPHPWKIIYVQLLANVPYSLGDVSQIAWVKQKKEKFTSSNIVYLILSKFRSKKNFYR